MNTIAIPANLGSQSQGVIRQPAGLSMPREKNAKVNESSAEPREVDSAKEPRPTNAATEPDTPEE